MSQVEDEVPGTVYILDQHENAGGRYRKKDIILRPTPSTDPSDPLRWPRWRKYYLLFLLVAYSSIIGATTNWDGTIYGSILEEYETTVFMLNIGQALLILMLGVANLIFTPLSDIMGRRFVYLLSLLIIVASQILLALGQNVAHAIVGHTLLGIGAAPFEALPAISISDVFFAHERATMLGAYVFGLALGSFMGPICAGYMAVSQGWRWVYWWGTIMNAVLGLIMVCTMEESNFVRSEDLSESAQSVPVDATVIDHTHSKAELTDQKGQGSSRISDESVREVFDVAGFKFFAPLWKVHPSSPAQFLRKVWRPLTVASFPPVLWCGINYGLCVSWLAILATTVSEIFSLEPYNFTPSNLGLLFISPLIGSFIGAYFSGPMNDQWSLYLSHRHHGVREPEYRLWAFIPSAVIMPGGLIMYGACAAHGVPWIASAVGMGMVGFGLSVGGSVTMAYILDCYKDLDGEVVTTIILIRNIIGFGLTFGIQPWIDNMGLQNTFITIGCLSFVVTVFSAVFIWKGKMMRMWTKQRYLTFKRE